MKYQISDVVERAFIHNFSDGMTDWSADSLRSILRGRVKALDPLSEDSVLQYFNQMEKDIKIILIKSEPVFLKLNTSYWLPVVRGE